MKHSLPFDTLPRQYRMAAPSWVIPGTLEQNCVFLSDKVDEVGLLFLQSDASLAYTADDLPLSLAELPLTWHVHLPLDLPWEHDNGGTAASICLSLMDKVRFLCIERAVLHPPKNANAHGILKTFAEKWRDSGRQTQHILLENTKDNDLVALGSCIGQNDFSLCIDLGHMLAYEQTQLCGALPNLGRIQMLHYNAPGGPGQTKTSPSAHLPLTELDHAGETLGQSLIGMLPKNGVIMLELFDWDEICVSIPIVKTWLAEKATSSGRTGLGQ